MIVFPVFYISSSWLIYFVTENLYVLISLPISLTALLPSYNHLLRFMGSQSWTRRSNWTELIHSLHLWLHFYFMFVRLFFLVFHIQVKWYNISLYLFLFIYLFIFFYGFKVFNSYMRSQTWTPHPPPSP